MSLHVFLCVIVTGMVIKARVLFYGVFCFRHDKRKSSQLRHCGVTMSQGQRASLGLQDLTHTLHWALCGTDFEKTCKAYVGQKEATDVL